MNVNIPDELRERIEAVAARSRICAEELVRRAVVEYLDSEEKLMQEFRAWEAVSAEALHKVLGDEETLQYLS